MSFVQQNLDIRAEQVLPGSERGWMGEGEGGGQGGEMTQTMYAHVNNCIIIIKKKNYLETLPSWNEQYLVLIGLVQLPGYEFACYI
jgi:hypothetical protein